MVIAAEALEILMLVCFGLSWPISVYKTWTSKTAVGKSTFSNIFIIIGYVGGIISKFLKMEDHMSDATPSAAGIFIFALVMYFINMAMVSTNLFLIYYYRAKEAIKAKAEKLTQEVVNSNEEEK